jgi:ferrous iron transport protein B
MEKKFTVALAGNPNCGKSTIFNSLTGARQHVGNYPGVTVEKKEGRVIADNYEVTVVDLPGTYSLSAGSDDEKVARDFILREKPDVVVHVIDASNLERNLYLATQLIELDAPLLLAMNMSDLVKSKGLAIDYKKLERLLNIPVVVTVGNKNEGVKDLLQAVISVYEQKGRTPARASVDYGAEIVQELEKLEQELARDRILSVEYPVRWLAVKSLENDPDVLQRIASSSVGGVYHATLEKSQAHLAAHFSETTDVLVADRRYGFVSGICAEVVTEISEARISASEKIDKIVLSRFFGLPVFALVMYVIFKFTFAFSAPVVGWVEGLFEWLGHFAQKSIPDGLLQSLVVDGIVGGVGGVLGFFPLVLFMFFAIAFFEDSGYMARAAFVMDKLMSKFGLHGKSFLPLMISTNGCAVPGLMATRTLESPRDRLITMMVVPFMICGAKLPIFALFIAAFFPAEQGAGMMMLMYSLSIGIAFGSAWILKTFVLKGESAHFVMELPPYRLPTIQGLLLKMWERGWLYLRKAGTIILLLSVVIWAAFKFPEVAPTGDVVGEVAAAYQMEHSYAGQLAGVLAPVLKPIGMEGSAGVALIAGLAAKEIVVSTLGTVYSLGEVDPEDADSLKEQLAADPAWSPLKAVAFLVFCLIYAPCIVAITVFYRETGSKAKWLFFLLFWTTVLAWVAAFVVYQGGMLIGVKG